MKSGERVGILGVGSYVPETVRRNDWWPQEFTDTFAERRKHDVTSPEVFLSRARSAAQRIQFRHMLETYNDPFRGTHERRVLDPRHPPSFMEIAAARKALAHADRDAADIDCIIVYSAPGDNAIPGNAGIVQEALGARHAQILGIESGCASFITGLMVGDALIKVGQARHVLVVSSGAQTRVADPEDPGAVNFGDGAGAAVIGPVPAAYGFEGFAVRGVSALSQAICIGPKEDQPWYEAKGPMYILSRHLEVGREVVSSSCDIALEATQAALRKAGREPREISHWYSHQPVSWFSGACREASGLAHARTVSTFPAYAGMGPGNIGVNLDAAVQLGDLQHGDRLMLYACGAGFVWAAAVVTWSRHT